MVGGDPSDVVTIGGGSHDIDVRTDRRRRPNSLGSDNTRELRTGREHVACTDRGKPHEPAAVAT